MNHIEDKPMVLYRESNMSAHVFLNLLNKVWKNDRIVKLAEHLTDF